MLKHFQIAGVLMGSLVMTLPLGVQAKRAAPAEVRPVVKDGIQYAATHWGNGSQSKQNSGGYIQARNLKTYRLLWSVQVYKPRINSRLEKDVQDVFITSLSLNGKILEVKNEAGDTYLVDITTQKVAKKAK